MAIVKWQDPFSFWGKSLPSLWSDQEIWPASEQGLSVYETDNEVVAEANVPGVPAEEVDVSYEAGVLTIKAEHEETKEERETKKTVYRQARQAKYYYTTSVPYPVNADKIKAEVEDGVVKVTMPKSAEAKPRKVKVKKAVK